MSAPFPSGKLSTTRVRRPISRLSRSIMSFVRMRLRRPSGNPGSRQVVGPADPLPQAVGGGLQPPGLHLRGDGPGLVQRGFPGLHGEHGPQGRRRPFAVGRRRLGEHVAQEVHHAPPTPRLRRHRVHRGDQSRAPVADHEPHAPRAAFDTATGVTATRSPSPAANP